jgi:Domain of unknown function (DUF4956)
VNAELTLRLAIDLVAVAVLAYAIFLPRHRRMDLVVTYAFFNLGLFLALSVIAGGEVGIGVGFGLFAVLSIVRLRSEPFTNRELAYFFIALVLALVCAIDLGSPGTSALLAGIALAGAWVVDHPRLSRPTRRVELLLELVFANDEALRLHLEERLDATVAEVDVQEIDYVRETTRASVRYVPRPPAPRTADAPVLAG